MAKVSFSTRNWRVFVTDLDYREGEGKRSNVDA